MYTVKVADNYHYMDKDEVYTKGTYATWEEALAVATAIVDTFLLENYRQGMSSDDLYAQFTSFGEDPYILGEPDRPFSAWEYAKGRCGPICNSTDSDQPMTDLK